MTIQAFFNNLDITDGFSYDVAHNESPTNGYVVSPFLGRERQFAGIPSICDIMQYIIDNYDVLRKLESVLDDFPFIWGKDVVIGGWLDSATGIYYSDCSVVCDDILDAIRMGKDANQIAIFDLNTFTEIRI